MQIIPTALTPLAAYKQWIIWEPIWDETRRKYLKKPRNPITFHDHDPTDATIWMDAPTALAKVAERPGYGLGFVFADSDPFWFLDIDNCLTPAGVWSDNAQYLMSLFPGAAMEISHSGQGLHIFGTGHVPSHRCKNADIGSEFYTTGRFAALTGTNAVGDAATEHSAQLSKFIPYFFAPRATSARAEWTNTPSVQWRGPADDDKLIARMLNSRSAAGAFSDTTASLADLWTCNVDKLSVAYPDNFGGGRTYDGSQADQALCNHLAFWTGGDCDRIDRLYRRSELYRDKWEREDYRESTVLLAVSGCHAFYNDKKSKRALTDEDGVKAAESGGVQMSPTYRTGLQFLPPSAQAELFRGCVYVRSTHTIFTPDGAMLDSNRFRATYGGYLFAMDSINDRTERNAWLVFTESQAATFPRAHFPCFRPELPPGGLIEEDGAVLLNVYVPVDVPSSPGDVSLFLNHVAVLLPVLRDREILLAYMAAVVQYKGVKFKWAPLLQGAQGNGKSFLIEVLTAAVGQRYTHKPSASQLATGGLKFTAWLSYKLLIGIEEIYVSNKNEIAEALKPIITDSRIEMQAKGVDQGMGDNRANFVMCSNHKDAVIKNRGDRRIAPFFTAQQTPEDLHAAGMVEADGTTPTAYFPKLYDWLERRGGFAHITHYLQNYDIPASLNPATLCTRAPETSSTKELITLSQGSVEQEIQEAIYQSRPGFAGGWVSSIALDTLLQSINASRKVPRNKRAAILAELGYIPHPGLPDGRAGVFVTADNGKPQLYVKRGSIPAGMQGAALILEAYVKAQGAAASSVSAAFRD